MEALFFRFFSRALSEVLPGARLEKIFLPAPNIISLGLYLPPGCNIPGQEGHKTVYLHARYGTGRFFLFLSPAKTVQPDRAPAAAMRLRKHLRGKRIARVVSDWPHRRLLLVPAGDGPALILDPKSFPTLGEVPPQPEVGQADVFWPPLETVLDDPDIWQHAPQLSPEIRRRLAALPRDAARSLYARLADDTAEGWYLERVNGRPQALWPFAWPGRTAPDRTVERFDTVFAAAAAFGEPLAFGEVSGRETAPERTAKTAGKRRLSRALAKLAADESRMRAFITRRGEADLLAAHLHALDKTAKMSQLSLTGANGEVSTVSLDPALNLVQNMQKLYHLAAKGERGLIAIAARRRDLQDGKNDLQGREHASGHRNTAHTAANPRQGALRNVAAHVYRTSDGFTALRGKNARANEQILRLASAFDLWFHVADGPGAHVILRRDHPGQEIPRRSLEEAAGLASLASYAATATAANIMVARVADVRRFKGAATGQVSVGSILETIRVRPDPDLESLREPS